jgi:hypothetical protein
MAEKKEEKGGCLKGCLATLGVIFLILIIGGTLIYINWDRIRERVISQGTKYIESGIMNQLPKGVDKKEVEEIFAKAREAFKGSRFDKDKLKLATKEYKEAMKDGELSEKETERIIGYLRETFKNSAD